MVHVGLAVRRGIRATSEEEARKQAQQDNMWKQEAAWKTEEDAKWREMEKYKMDQEKARKDAEEAASKAAVADAQVDCVFKTLFAHAWSVSKDRSCVINGMCVVSIWRFCAGQS